MTLNSSLRRVYYELKEKKRSLTFSMSWSWNIEGELPSFEMKKVERLPAFIITLSCCFLFGVLGAEN